MKQDFYIDSENSTDGMEIHSNFTAVLDIVREALNEADQARLVQALIPRPEPGEVTPYTWITDAHYAINQATRIMSKEQLDEWDGWEAALREAPILEAQRLSQPDQTGVKQTEATGHKLIIKI